MHRSKALLLAPFALAACATAMTDPVPVPVAAAQTDCDVQDSAQIVEHMDQLIDTIEGLTGRIVLTRCGEKVFDETHGFADRNAGTPIADDMLFDVGSLTKQFVAAAILQLRDEGRLNLRDTLGAHIPDLPEDIAAITIHQLLVHSSGLPLYSGDDYDQVTREQYLTWLRSIQLEQAPGTKDSYSNPGYTTLAVVVELASGERFEDYVQRHLLIPHGIVSTGYRSVSGPLAINYTADGTRDGTPLEKAWGPYGPYWNLMGGGGMLSTADDMARWFDALRNGQILSPRSTEEMFTGHVAREGNDEIRHGYGWRIIDDDRGHWINHGGSNGASFYSDVRWFEATDTTMVVTLNAFDIKAIRSLVRGFAEVAGTRNIE